MKPFKKQQKIVILGAGPTGLGAAVQLQSLNYENWVLFEQNNYPGGLAATITDEKGFLWDLGGHVQFSHYHEFDLIMNTILDGKWGYHDRSAWIWMRNLFVKYPFQHNYTVLPKSEADYCSKHLPVTLSTIDSEENFDEWINNAFGIGIADTFMLPYNTKVWAYPLNKLSSSWVKERVAKLSVDSAKTNKKDWGPNSKFRFPLFGGTGAIWDAVSKVVPKEKIIYNHKAVSINTVTKKIIFSNGREENYDKLITTMPLDAFVNLSDLQNLKKDTVKLKHSSTYVIGIGVKGTAPPNLKGKSWIYFPEENFPFYRLTIFSNYSPNNVPSSDCWSILIEISASKYKQVDAENLIYDVIRSLSEAGFIHEKNIISKWSHFMEYGYPLPTLDRDDCLNKVLPYLSSLQIFSRGRFGAWKYEVSNQDHSYMQGVECVNYIVNGQKETTIWHPDLING